MRTVAGAAPVGLALTTLGLGACADEVVFDPGASDLVVVADGLASPVDLAPVPNDPDRIYIVEKPGRIRVLSEGELRPAPALDITASTSSDGEQGLLGIAFSPDFGTDRHIFVNHTALDGATRIVRFTVTADPEVVDANSEVEVLRIDQPFSNHNGGQIAFGPDGLLYVGMGDGGSGGDPQGHGQDRTTLLGAMLRIDVSSLPYSIPADNPYAGSLGLREEIWAYGLRNPWRFSFDPETGHLWIGDVGQGAIEEVTRMTASDAGANLGWAAREGTRCFASPACDNGPFLDPVHEYDHGDGCSVTGGVVYRGPVASLRGRYLFGDFCDGWIRSFPVDDPGAVFDHTAQFGTVPALSAFGVDGESNVYVLSLGGTVWRLAGVS